MEVRPHDLLLIHNADALVSQSERLRWIYAALERAPYVVVRRTRAAAGMIAVGVRGQSRGERYAAFLPVDAIRQQIIPEQLARARAWTTSPRLSICLPLQALIPLAELLEASSLAWGPVGSVGFELASERPTITASSDLDILIRAPERLSRPSVSALLTGLASMVVRVDIQVETHCGAFALAEYGRGASRVMLRTHDGPGLVHDPWECEEQAKGAHR